MIRAAASLRVVAGLCGILVPSLAAAAASNEAVEKLVAEVVRGFALAAHTGVASCLAADATAHPARLDEVQRLATIVAWIESAIIAPRRSGGTAKAAQAAARGEALAEIVASFNHERRIDAALLTRISDGQLQPRHISAYARVTRALSAGHDPRRVLCGD